MSNSHASAFPYRHELNSVEIEIGTGLTKREYIAAQIMAQMAVQDGHVATNAARAVRAADELLKALSVG